MKVFNNSNQIIVDAKDYKLTYDSSKPMYVGLEFNNGLGAELFVPSGCDRDEMIDEIVRLEAPVIKEKDDQIHISFIGETTLWEMAVYTFKCLEDKVLYSYKILGNGKLDNARFFEGFLKDDPRIDDKNYPLFCGWGRHVAWHRPVKAFMQSSEPKFHTVYSSGINSADIRYFSYHESTMIRIDSGRIYLGGDWLVTPPPFLYIIGNKEKTKWVNMGLVEKSGDCNFMDYEYSGGEGFGLNVNYDGYTEIKGSWQSPTILFQMCDDVYDGTAKHAEYLRSNGLVKKNHYRDNIPRWWKEPIFGGWGEQMFHAHHWEDYFQGQAEGYSSFGAKLCTRVAYEKMLATLEDKGVDPTILIVDNRWFEEDCQLSVDDELWPDMKSFIKQQHEKGRKVILWVSPFAYCQSKAGKDVPTDEHMVLNEDENYILEIDTDVFYPACNLAKKKVRKKPHFEPQEKKEHVLWDKVLDVLNPDYEKRVREKVNYLLSPDGLDADGFEFDYTHFLPINRGMHPVSPRTENIWGVEYLHKILWIYYDEAKKAKSDSLIISHTFNPHFDDVVDMLRLQDIYTDNRSIVDQMNHRAKIAKIVAPDCVIHTDQHPMPSLEAWAEYAEFQPSIGNPCLYYVSGIETTKEKFREEDWELLRRTWGDYDAKLTAEYGPRIIPGNSSKKKETVSKTSELGLPYRAPKDDLKWFRDAKFGMFIHWGPVSLTGAELSWAREAKRPFDVKDGGSPSETGWKKQLVPGEEYDELYKRFNPVNFDADQWAKIAKDAGMKYLVFTAKHHDGFSNFHTKYSDYNIANTPFKRDIVKEISDACRRHGLKFGVYYSQRDWYHPAYLRGDNSEYRKFMFNQISELLINYGKVDIIWFDSFGESDLEKDWDIDGLLDMMRKLQPGILVNNRLAVLEKYNKGPEKYWGDFDTPEQKVGSYQIDRPWESCITLVGNQWSWKPDGEMYTLKECIDKLVMSVCSDGNLLLNVGPMPTGEIEERQVTLLKEIGDWLNKYGEAIYGTRGGPLAPFSWGGFTSTEKHIFLHVIDTDQKELQMPDLPVTDKYQVLTGDDIKLNKGNKKATLVINKVSKDSNDIVVRFGKV